MWKPYKSYRFIDKDPIIDVMRTMMAESGMTIGEIAKASGVSRSCIANWFEGDTKRPQHASTKAAITVMGYHLVAVKGDGYNLVNGSKPKKGKSLTRIPPLPDSVKNAGKI
jgi:predicted transcriptional regulator